MGSSSFSRAAFSQNGSHEMLWNQGAKYGVKPSPVEVKINRTREGKSWNLEKLLAIGDQ